MGEQISLELYVRGNTRHGGTHITVTPGMNIDKGHCHPLTFDFLASLGKPEAIGLGLGLGQKKRSFIYPKSILLLTLSLQENDGKGSPG